MSQKQPSKRRSNRPDPGDIEVPLLNSSAEHSELATNDLTSLIAELRAQQSELETQNRELQELQLELAESRDRYSDLFEFAPVGYVTLDTAGCIREANTTITSMLGISRQDLMGARLSQFVAATSQDELFLHQRRAFHETSHTDCEVEMQRSDGSRLWVRLESIAFGTGKDRQLRTALIDVSENKRNQERQKRQSEQLRILWNAAEVLLTASDPPAMLNEMFGRISNQLDVDTYFNFVVDDSGKFLRLVSCGGIPEDAARDIQRLEFGQAVCGTVAANGQPIIATHIQTLDDPQTELIKDYGIRAYACNPLILEDRLIGTLSFGSRSRDEFEDSELSFFRTISRYVTVAYARLRLVKELQKAHRRKDEFLAMLAHELRNPLAPIRSGLDLLEMDTAKQQEIVPIMHEQVEHLVRLVDDLLDVSRIMRGRIELRKEPVELAALVKQSVDAVQHLLHDRQQELRVSLPDEPIWLNADGVRMIQAIENLLRNASKFTDPEGSVELNSEQQDGQAIITVRDTGIGIDSELMPNLFDLFTQSPRTLDRSQGGLGIGLTLVRRIVELHEGRISAESDGPGQGSTFTIRLPLTEEPVRLHQVEHRPPLAHNLRILVVDDNAGATHLLRKLLEKLDDHQIETARDGPSAVEKIREWHPNLVLLDIGLPGMDGYQVAREIRKNCEFDDVLLVALTGYGQDNDKRKSIEAGLDEHLVKPPSVDQIREILRHPKLAKWTRSREPKSSNSDAS